MRLVICLIVVLSLSGCDYVKQHFDNKVPITLKIDSNWVEQSKLEFLKNELQAYLDERKFRYLSLKQQDTILLIKYEHDPAMDLTVDLEKEFPEFYFTNTNVMLEPENRQIVVALPDKTRSELIQFARNYNNDAVIRLMQEKGISVETKTIGSDRFVVYIPESSYSDVLVSSLLYNENLAFYLVAKDAQPDTFMVKDNKGKTLYLQRPKVIASESIINAEASHDQNNQPALMIALDSVGANIMEKTTRENLGRQMAVVLIENSLKDKAKQNLEKYRVLSVATIQGVFSKRFMISGLESMREAEDLAVHIRAGDFAAPMRLVSDSKTSQRPGKSRGE